MGKRYRRSERRLTAETVETRFVFSAVGARGRECCGAARCGGNRGYDRTFVSALSEVQRQGKILQFSGVGMG